MLVWYIYPQWHRVSFTLIAEKHVEQLRRYCRVYTFDELAIPHMMPYTKPIIFIHPYFYPVSRFENSIKLLRIRSTALIGVDVADTDRISDEAVRLTHYTTAMIVPSHYAKRAYEVSGVKVPVHVIPHGLDKEWFTSPPSQPIFFKHLLEHKRKHGLKYILFYLWHSERRKGADLVLETYSILRRERKDVMLIVKTLTPDGVFQDMVRRLGGYVVSGWLTEKQKIELYDICDIYLLFSRGGGFEINGLEALARGEIVLAPKGGAWEEYMPEWSLVPSHPCDDVLPGNNIHVGRGVEVDVERAVDIIHNILDNLSDFKARVKEYRAVLAQRFNWEVIGRMLLEVLERYKP